MDKSTTPIEIDTATKMSQTVLQIEEQYAHIDLTQYKSTYKAFGYQSNLRSSKHIELQASLFSTN